MKPAPAFKPPIPPKPKPKASCTYVAKSQVSDTSSVDETSQTSSDDTVRGMYIRVKLVVCL